MFRNNLSRRVFNEADDGSDLGGAAEGVESTGEGSTPSYLFGDVTAEEAAERFGYLRDLPESLRGLESRVSDTVSPVLEQLQALGEKVGTQPVFEPNLDRTRAALEKFDPRLAEAIMGPLVEDLQGAMSITPLGPEVLQPHINPMVESAQQQLVEQILPALFSTLPFDADAIVNRDSQNPDKILEPTTELQKDFAAWWDKADAPTRRDLATLGIPHVQRLQQFGRWRAEQIKRRGQAAAEGSERLKNAAQGATAGRRERSSGRLETEADGFYSVFKKKGA